MADNPFPFLGQALVQGSALARLGSLDLLEKSIAKSLNTLRLRPGRRNAAAVHDDMQRALIAGLAQAGEPGYRLPASALERVVENSRSSDMIDAALKKASQAHAEALLQAGISESAFEILQSWVEVMVDTRVMQQRIELQRAMGSLEAEMASHQARPALQEDPVRPLSAAQLGMMLGGISDERVRQRERAGELFSVLRPGRKRGREYPVFQAWAGVEGEPLTRVLLALRPASNVAIYGFFTSPTDELGGLTPIEIMIGRLTSMRVIDQGARELLDAAEDERLHAVLRAAESYATSLEA
jgi:hypothetical protein